MINEKGNRPPNRHNFGPPNFIGFWCPHRRGTVSRIVSIPSCPATVLINQQVVFIATPLDGIAPYTYQWYVVSMSNGGAVDRVRDATSSTFRFTESAPGTYLISVAILDSSGSGVHASYPRTGGLSVHVVQALPASPPPSPTVSILSPANTSTLLSITRLLLFR